MPPNSRKRLSVGNGKRPSIKSSLLGYSGTGGHLQSIIKVNRLINKGIIVSACKNG
jgi:hypothetical protein